MAFFDFSLVNGIRDNYAFVQLLLNRCIDFMQSLQTGVYHCKIQVRFDIGGNRQHFDGVMAPFCLGVC